MIRISTIFIAVCMVLICGSLGAVLHALAGFTAMEAVVIAVASLTFLLLYNAVSMRMRQRTDVGNQIADLSRGTADLARQVAENGRRLAAAEARIAAADGTGQERIHSVMAEINELGSLVKQLAVSVAAQEARADRATPPSSAAPALDVEWSDAGQSLQPAAVSRSILDSPVAEIAAAPSQLTTPPNPTARTAAAMRDIIQRALVENRFDIYLQPVVTLPQRKVRHYEALSRLRDENGAVIAAADFIGVAQEASLISQIDDKALFRCVQVLRRLTLRNKEIGLFCNLSAATLKDTGAFTQCLEFLEANRALAPSLVLEFSQAAIRAMTPAESEHLAALAQRGFRFSIDHVTDLRMEPRDLADRGVRFIKAPAALLLDQKHLASSDIHPADLSDLLGRFGIDLVAERIESERTVVDLLDYDVRYGQGFLFSPPRPLRPDGAPVAAASETALATATENIQITPVAESIEARRIVGNAALARRANN